MQLASNLKFYVHHAVLICENGTDVIVKYIKSIFQYLSF